MAVTLYEGDCLDVFSQIASVHDVDAVIADIPYGTTQCRWDSPLPLDAMWEGLREVCSDDTPIVLFAQTPFDKMLGASNIKELRYEWIWEKTAATGHLNAKRMPMKAHENILVFYRKLPTYNPQKTFGHERKVSTARHRRNSSESELYSPGHMGDKSSYDSTERYPRSVLLYPTDKQKVPLHPTQKPVALMKYLVETYTNPGGTVLDFTMGSGSTGVAAVESGRSFVGVEKDHNIFGVAAKRIRQSEDDDGVIVGTFGGGF